MFVREVTPNTFQALFVTTAFPKPPKEAFFTIVTIAGSTQMVQLKTVGLGGRFPLVTPTQPNLGIRLHIFPDN
jgi:hypothetical protein